MKFLKKIFGKYLTNAVQTREIAETRDTNGSENREVKKLIIESFHCPHCGSTKFGSGSFGGGAIELEFFEEQIKNILSTRFKILHLQRSWVKFTPNK